MEPQRESQQIPMRSPSGDVRLYTPDEAKEVEIAGGRVATPQEVDETRERARRQAEYGGIGGAAEAASAAFGRGLSFGFSDAAIVGLGGEPARKRLQGLQEVNPIVSTGGEIAGAIAPLLLSRGGSAGLSARGLVRGIGAIPRGVAALGGAAERAASGLVGREAISLGGKLVQRAIPMAAAGATEGALYGVGHEVSDAVIQDHELTAEKIIAGAGGGALFGGAIGGGLGLASGLAGAAVRASPVAAKSLSVSLDDMAGGMAWRSAGPTKRMTQSADAFAGGHGEVGKRWIKEVPKLLDKTSFASVTREELPVAARLGKQKYAADIVSTLGEADAVGANVRVADVVADLDGVASKLRGRVDAAAAEAKLESVSARLQKITGYTDETGQLAANAADKRLSLTELHGLRAQIDNVTRFDPTVRGFEDSFRQARDALETRLTTTADRFAKEAQIPNWQARYTEAKKGYQAYRLLDDASRSGVAAAGTSRILGLAEHIGGAAGAAAGATIGGPVGGIVGWSLGAAAQHLIKRHGAFVAAGALDKIARLGAIERMSAQVDQRISNGVSAFLATPRRIAVLAQAPLRSRAEYERRALQLSAMQDNDSAKRAHIERTIGPTLANTAPSITAQTALAMSRIITAAGDAAPTFRYNAASLQPHKERHRTSDAEIYKFARYIDGLEDPLSVLDDMKHGQLSRNKVKAMRDNFPRLFTQVREEVIQQVAKMPKKLSYQQRAQIATLFGFAADASFDPQFVAAQQGAKAGPTEPEERGSAEGTSQRPIRLNTHAYETETQAAEAT